MSKGRKAFGPSKKQACDLHHCKKKKGAFSKHSESTKPEIKHSRINTGI
ncbi:MAG: hypothetical protein PHO70_02165 [Candidatus Omnitrophica bacterium]|nr:hypothetical protein [Candidatus Omnitrophota bacterium]